MNFIIKYHIKVIKSFSFKENKLNLNNENTLSYTKHAHKIILQKLIFDIKL